MCSGHARRFTSNHEPGYHLDMRTLLSAGLALSCGLWLGCRSDFDDGCELGSEGCACAEDATCLAGLSCMSDLCVAPGDGDGDGDGDNLLANPSFEDWNGATPFGWELEADAWEQTMDAATDGSSAVRVTAAGYAGISQEVIVDQAAGTRFNATVSARHVSDDLTGAWISINLHYADDSDESEAMPLPSFPGNDWVTGGVTIEATADVTQVRVSLDMAQGDMPQTVDFDAASLSIVQ